MENITIATYCDYNSNRYSTPWVCLMTKDGQYDFKTRIGTFTGRNGEGGELVVFRPVEGQVYGYGRKDYRGKNTRIYYAKWDGEAFVRCNKLGKIVEE